MPFIDWGHPNPLITLYYKYCLYSIAIFAAPLLGIKLDTETYDVPSIVARHFRAYDVESRVWLVVIKDKAPDWISAQIRYLYSDYHVLFLTRY